MLSCFVHTDGDGPVLIRFSTQVPLDEFESNLTEIVSIFQKSHSADVLLLTPSTLSIEMVNRGFATSGITRPAGYIKNNELHRAYADAVVRVGQQTGSKVVDLYKTFEARSPHQDELFTDGIHYTPKGYAVSSVRALIESEVPDLPYPSKVITRALRKAIDSDLPHLSPWMMPKAHEPFMFYPSDDDGLLGEFTAKLNELFTSQGIPGDTFREKLEEKDRRDAMEERKKLLSREI